MQPKLGHSPRGGLRAQLTVHVCLLCYRLRASSTTPGEREMGNSMKSTPAPPERPLPSTDGKSHFFGETLDCPERVLGDRGRWKWGHGCRGFVSCLSHFVVPVFLN